MRRLLPLLLLLGCGLLAGTLVRTAAATTIYQCVGADGRTVFQDKPCTRNQHQQKLRLPDVPTLAPPPAPAQAPTTADTAPPPPAPEPLPSPAPLPTMYTCVRATDGSSYLSANGDPQPYLAPYGIVGEPRSLADAYGPGRGAAGGSAPEANHGRVSSDLVANNYVWVQDQCRALDPAETCQALQQAWEDNEHKLHNAFQSQRPPLEKREAELSAQLASCRG